jgi:murein DD-endopeptidase MepM/ murein hydrolase activator NlpD
VPTHPITGVALPTEGIRSYEYQRSPTHKHNGIDLAAPEGTPIRAAAGGLVQYATYAWQQGFSGYGRVVVVAQDDGTHALYAHLQTPAVAAGEPVLEGDLIGWVGRTEYSSNDHESHVAGPHLHFEVSALPYPQASTARRIDPVAWLRGEGDITRPIARPTTAAVEPLRESHAGELSSPRSSLLPSLGLGPHCSPEEGGDDET